MLAFPGIFRGALDVRASDINEEMKLAAAKAIAACVSDEELNAEYIMPMAFDKKVIRSVADAVAQAARRCGPYLSAADEKLQIRQNQPRGNNLARFLRKSACTHTHKFAE